MPTTTVLVQGSMHLQFSAASFQTKSIPTRLFSFYSTWSELANFSFGRPSVLEVGKSFAYKMMYAYDVCSMYFAMSFLGFL